MMLYTHLAFACLCSLIATKYVIVDNRVQFLAVAIAAAALVDLDHVTSWIGKKLEPLSVTIKLLFSHRGFFHSITAAALTYIIIYIISKEAALAAFIGYSSHIALDALNRSGVRIFSPFSKYNLRGCIKTGSITEHLLLAFIISGIIYMVF